MSSYNHDSKPCCPKDSAKATDLTGKGNSASTFTKRPDLDGSFSKKGSWFKSALMGVALLATTFGAFNALQDRSPSSVMDKQVVASKEERKVLELTNAEIDHKTTQEVREALINGEDHPIVAQAEPKIREAIISGDLKLFKIHMIDTVAEDGDVVTISIDGALFGQVLLSHAGATLTIPAQPGQSHDLKIHALKDGGGGVTFGARTNSGDVISQVMPEGSYEHWIVKGGL